MNPLENTEIPLNLRTAVANAALELEKQEMEREVWVCTSARRFKEDHQGWKEKVNDLNTDVNEAKVKLNKARVALVAWAVDLTDPV